MKDRQVEVLIFWREAQLSLSGHRHDVIHSRCSTYRRKKKEETKEKTPLQIQPQLPHKDFIVVHTTLSVLQLQVIQNREGVDLRKY